MRTTLENILLTYAFDSTWNDDHDGDVESPSGYFARFVVADLAEAFLILDDYEDTHVGDVDDFAPGDLVGAWFVWQDSNGSVNYVHRPLAERGDIDMMWSEAWASYDAWITDDENEV